MTVTYMLEPRDLRAFQRYTMKHLPNLRRIRYFYPVLIVVFSAWFAFSVRDEELGSGPGPHLGFRVFYFCLLALVLWGLWRGLEWILLRLVQWRAYTSDKQRSVICEHTVTLADDALVEVTAFNEGRNRWGGIYQVVDTADYIYIFVSLHMAHVIPKRAFADAESARRFYERAVSLHSAARALA